ncbi:MULTISPECIES: DUF2382 domain-containing protein [Leptolyngbya]|uniref:DUF2382 domain-containing protein n=1 Tax=Leptolyngbya TaxID=47251 RepID=UPI001683A04A|nr:MULTISPECIES: DUF2382 domain-containing protein [unclassified Leptolyngbya]MBD1854017.1 DUF2382 domain-containing protein [Leptolyngbya sp. FACHB-1624]MCY6493789.1 DUF2382 domain-containing protein [Leptolyngbya sp. GGD]
MTSQPHSLLPSEEIDLTPEQAIRLLEERLIVRSDKRKVGEIVVRKEVEVRMVEVPVRREKLIVEQVQPKYERLAEIDLGQTTETAGSGAIVSGKFDSPRAVSDLLDAIARTPDHSCAEIRVEIKLKDSKHQETYQTWFDRCRKS